MKYVTDGRGFRNVQHAHYPPNGEDLRIASESTAIGDYEDSFQEPGSSFLWIGRNHHLNREEVAELIASLQYWIEHKRLPESLADIL